MTTKGTKWSPEQRAKRMKQIGSLSERFWRSVKMGAPSDCWIWTGLTLNTGYGQIQADGKGLGAHRASWNLHFGKIPKGAHVCHRCDVRTCVNPDHLFLGSSADNVADMVDKGRNEKGSNRYNAKITEADVRKMRALRKRGLYQRDIGEKFGISQVNVSKILRGVAWGHVS